MRNRPRALLALPLPLLALAGFPLTSLACGGRTIEAFPGGSQSAGNEPSSNSSSNSSSSDHDASAAESTNSSGGGSSGSTPFPICPNLAPTVGWTCSTPSQGCAYVDYDKGTCISFVCDSGGHWASSTPAGC